MQQFNGRGALNESASRNELKGLREKLNHAEFDVNELLAVIVDAPERSEDFAKWIDQNKVTLMGAFNLKQFSWL